MIFCTIWFFSVFHLGVWFNNSAACLSCRAVKCHLNGQLSQPLRQLTLWPVVWSQHYKRCYHSPCSGTFALCKRRVRLTTAFWTDQTDRNGRRTTSRQRRPHVPSPLPGPLFRQLEPWLEKPVISLLLGLQLHMTPTIHHHRNRALTAELTAELSKDDKVERKMKCKNTINRTLQASCACF